MLQSAAAVCPIYQGLASDPPIGRARGGGPGMQVRRGRAAGRFIACIVSTVLTYWYTAVAGILGFCWNFIALLQI